MCPSLIQIGSKTAEKNSAQANKQTNRHYENNGHLAVNQNYAETTSDERSQYVSSFCTDTKHWHFELWLFFAER